jgi:ParB/RepB/Spo0J family partition protein
MSQSIAAVGVLHPIHIRPTQSEETGAAYTLIAGLYRLLAARRAGWTEIPCTIHEVDEATAEAIAFEENETRSPLSVLDTARYVDQVRRNHIRRGERSTNEALGTFFRPSAAWISQRLTIHKGIPDALLARAAIPAAELVQLSKDALLTAAQITGDDQRHREEKQVAFLQAAAGDLRASAGVENILGKRSAARRPPLEIHQHRDGSVTIRCDPDRVAEINNRAKRELITQLRHLATPLGLTVTATRRRSRARSARRRTRPSSDSSTAGPA